MATSFSDRRLSWRADPLRALFDYAVSAHKRAAAVLIVASLISFVPGLFQIPPVDRDEARFAQATKQMLETGDYIDIRFQDEVRYKKPVGIYWLQAGVVKAASALGVPDALTTISLYRLPSLAGAIGAVLLTYWTALAFVSRRAALMAGLMMAASILLGVEARLATTDAMLLLTILAAMGAMARAYLGDARQRHGGLAAFALPAIFWTALAAGILLKGPVILMFVGLTIAALAAVDRSLRWLKALRPFPGAILMLVLVLPWFVAILGRAGNAFVADSLGQDLLSKIFSSQESHGAPPGYYFVLFWVTFWPGAALAALCVPAIWASRREKGARFLLAWLLPGWIAFEMVVTKLPHYVLPLYPAVAILIAGVVDPHVLARQRWLARSAAWWFAFPVIASLGGIVLLLVIGRQLGLLAWPFAASAMILGLFAWRLYGTEGGDRSLARAIAASLMISIATYGIVMPSLGAAFPSLALAQVLRGADCDKPAAAAVGFHEPSLVFLLGSETRLTDGTGAADFLRLGGCRFALIEQRQERGFLRRADAIGLRYAQGPRIDGFNISNGRRISIAVYRSEVRP